MDRFVKLNDLKGYDEEFKNALGELEQRIFESYNNFMPVKDGGRPSTVEGEHPMFTEFKENFGYDQGGRKYLKLVTGAFGEGQTSVWGFIAKEDFGKVGENRRVRGRLLIKNLLEKSSNFLTFNNLKQGRDPVCWETKQLVIKQGTNMLKNYKPCG